MRRFGILVFTNFFFLLLTGCDADTNSIEKNMFYEDFGTNSLQFNSCYASDNNDNLNATAIITNIPSDEYTLLIGTSEVRLFLNREVVDGVGIIWKDSASDLELIKHEDGSISYKLNDYYCIV